MESQAVAVVARLSSETEKELVEDWLSLLKTSGILSTGRLSEAELQTQCISFLRALAQADAPEGLERVRQLLADIARSRASLGFSARETTTFVFSLKHALSSHPARCPDLP